MGLSAPLGVWLGNMNTTMDLLRRLDAEGRDVSTVRNVVGNLVFENDDEAIAWLDTPTGVLHFFGDFEEDE